MFVRDVRAMSLDVTEKEAGENSLDAFWLLSYDMLLLLTIHTFHNIPSFISLRFSDYSSMNDKKGTRLGRSLPEC